MVRRSRCARTRRRGSRWCATRSGARSGRATKDATACGGRCSGRTLQVPAFTTGTAWLGIGPDAHSRTVERQRAEPNSVLNFCRALLRIRRSCAVLCDGAYLALPSDRYVFAFQRSLGRESVLVILNTAPEARPASTCTRYQHAQWHVALSTHRPSDTRVPLPDLRVAPFEALVLVGGDTLSV